MLLKSVPVISNGSNALAWRGRTGMAGDRLRPTSSLPRPHLSSTTLLSPSILPLQAHALLDSAPY